MDKSFCFRLVIGIFMLISVEGCLLPLTTGTWVSSTRGTWTLSDNGTHSTVTNFAADLTLAATTATLECKSSSGTQYVLGTSFEIFFLVFIDVYVCIDIQTTTVSPNSYVYYIVTPTDTTTGEQFTSDITSVCSNTNYATAINTHIILKSGSETAAAVNFVDAILGNYTLDYWDIDGNSVTGSDMDSCNDTTQMVYNNGDTATKLAFTSENTLLSLHYVTSGSSVYAHTYNPDATVTNPTTYRIACWVIVNSGGQVKATVYPNECIQGQTSTSVAYGGQKFVFTPRYTCPLNQAEEPTGLAGWQVALIVLGVLALILIVLIIILYILSFRYQRRAIADDDPEKKIIGGDGKTSPDSLKGKDYDSGYDEKFPFKRGKTREHTFDLTEVKNNTTKKLQDGKPADKVTEEPIRPLIEFPPGKKPIPPTTPKPDADDLALAKIRKERERKEKERLEKKKKEKEAKEEKMKKEEKPQDDEDESKVVRNVRHSPSSDEYESDESTKAERMKQLLAKRKRLAKAGYDPPEGLQDATVVGKKKRRQLREGEEGGDLTKSLTNREQQEQLDTKRRLRKKSMKKLAKQKFRPSDIETSDSETDASTTKKRFKRRKKGDPRGVRAPYTEQYDVKKGIEKELDDKDYWHEKEKPTVITDEEADENEKKVAIQVAPVDTAKAPADVNKDKSGERLAQIMEEEADVWAAHGLRGFKLGPDGELPEGFHFDDLGNIVRNVDGKVIPKEAFAKRMDIRRKYIGVFSLPRLIRNSEGRPLGGYKDDEFGPTAEWDYGLPSNNEDEDETKRTEAHQPSSGRQVAFSVQDGNDVQATPLKDLDYSQIKGRQLGSAERTKLKDRLFESQPEKEEKTTLPVYFKGSKGGVKPESVYISNAQIERQLNPSKVTGSSMVTRSDTFDDGRRMIRGSKGRSSWNGRGVTAPANAAEQQGLQGISRGKKNIGSDDEFFLVAGSLQKIDKPPHTTDSHLAAHWCTRYERHGHLPVHDTTEMSDLNMRTAPNSNTPFSGSDRNMRKLLQELYPDKKYFDYYVKSENLPTNAAVETRDLASHGQQFLKDRAEYWAEHQPIDPIPPPSELGLRLSRMPTFQTNADSGMDSMMTSARGRPHTADEPRDTARTGRENSEVPIPLPSHRTARTGWTKDTEKSERRPPTGMSEGPPSPTKLEADIKEKTTTINVSPRDKKKKELNEAEPKEEHILKSNMLSITDT